MIFLIIRSECAPGIADASPIFKRAIVSSNAAAINLTARFGLDRLSADRRLICHWAREIDGRLACHWEPDIVPIPPR
jgi:hypothetical protein